MFYCNCRGQTSIRRDVSAKRVVQTEPKISALYNIVPSGLRYRLGRTKYQRSTLGIELAWGEPVPAIHKQNGMQETRAWTRLHILDSPMGCVYEYFQSLLLRGH